MINTNGEIAANIQGAQRFADAFTDAPANQGVDGQTVYVEDPAEQTRQPYVEHGSRLEAFGLAANGRTIRSPGW